MEGKAGKVATVDEYIAQQPEAVRRILEEIRRVVREAAAGSFYNEWRSAVFHHDTAWDTDQGGSYDVMFAPMGGDITNVAGANGIAEYDASMFGRKIVYAMEMPMADVDIWMTWASPEVDRTEGDNRFLTAIETSKAYFEGAESAVLCTAYNFPDALSAAPLARMLRGPLLLTMPSMTIGSAIRSSMAVSASWSARTSAPARAGSAGSRPASDTPAFRGFAASWRCSPR